MKKIEIERITLRNWRGEKERTTAFSTDAPTYICGDNGLGKSRHFDAFCWLLFGKDSQNRTDYELRTYDAQHRPLHHCECSVEATLLIDGERLTVKREWVENWVKPKGQPDEVFKNNETRCQWNGAPVTKTEYGKRVRSLFGLADDDKAKADTLFMVVTNPHYFPSIMTWQQQREVLMQIAGTRSDYEIAADNADFRKLLDELGGKPLADFRKEIAATKKRLDEELDKVPTRIDEVQRNTPASENWEALQEIIKEKRHDIEQIDKQLQDSDARDAAKRKERNGINQEIEELRQEQQSLVRKAKAEAQAKADKQNEHRRTLEANLKRAHERLSEATIDAKRNADRIGYLEASMRRTDEQLEALRQEWYGINATKYDDTSDICPCCGQRMPEEKIAEAHAKFAEEKKRRLEANNEKGRSLSAQKKSLAVELDEKKAQTEQLTANVEKADTDVKTYNEALMDTPMAKVEAVAADSLPRWAESESRVQELTKRLDALREGCDDAAELKDLQARKGDLQCSIDALNTRLAKRAQIDDAEKRMAELKARGKDLAQQIADVEKREYTAAQFSKKRIEDCEKRINSMFKAVRFKLFAHTLEGNEYECCVPLVNGVPYQVANTASQINAGLDIINTLCRFYNVSAPVFIDGAESVNSYTETSSQIIFLQVTNDKQLVIK